MANLKVNFCKVEFNNPFILPSGIIQEIPDHKRAIEGGAGGVTTKSITIQPREGYPIPRILRYEHGIINAVGIKNPGIKNSVKPLQKLINSVNVPIIISVFATSVKDFQCLVSEAVKLKPAIIELNLSCPHVSNEFGASLSSSRDSAIMAVKAAKKEADKIPIIAKLTPNIPGIAEIAKGCEDAGADGITAINAVGPGMVIDIKLGKPVLGNKKGGVSGPGILPIAVRCVYEIYEAVKIPIIGMGGVSKWQDVVQMLMAGATLVGVGTATYTEGMKVYDELKRGLSEYMDKEGIDNLKELTGIAHKN